jgi:hypothetical protein
MASAGSAVGSGMPVWVPLVFLKPVFLWSFVFYVIVGVACRGIVKRIWTGEDKLSLRKRDTIGRWTPSLIHALIATTTASAACFGFIAPEVFSNEDVIMHSLGYFMGDLIVDRDPGYVVHHVGPVLHAEVMLRLGAHFWHTMRAGLIMEAGNVVAHSAAVLTFRRGKMFHMFNTWSFWISRPASYYDGFMAWYSDVPSHVRFTWLGLIPLISILGIYHANTKWMIKMCRTRKRPATDAASEDPACIPTGAAATSAGATNGSGSAGAAASPSGVSDKLPKVIDATLPADVPLQRVSSRKGSRRDKDA